MASDESVSIGVVGCGGISHAHIAGIRRHAELRVVACADVDGERARTWGKSYAVAQCFADWKEMVEKMRPDVLLFATWPAQHREQVVAAAEMGVRAILCEKSLALTAADGQAMAAACRKSGTLLMEGFMYRHTPRTRDFIERVRGGEVGDLRCARAAFSSLFYNPRGENWRHRKETGGGIVYDFTCYCVNILRALCARPPRRVAATAEVCPAQSVVVTMNAVLDYGDGVTGFVESSQKEFMRAEAEAVGTSATLLLPLFLMNNDAQATLPMRKGEGHLFAGNWHETEIPTVFENPYGLQMENLARALRHGEPLVMPLDETLENLATLDALVRSAETGRFEEVSA
jgi:predicted dehydrogenase